jgi:hypothetical protein
VYAPTRKSALLNTLGVAPKLRQNRFKYSATMGLFREFPVTLLVSDRIGDPFLLVLMST